MANGNIMKATARPMVSASLNPSRTLRKTGDARRRKRIRLSLPVHVRPFESRLIDIEDVGEVVDFTQDGLLFVTCMPHYQIGMRLIVTFPFGQRVAAHRKFLGTVVRLEERASGNSGVGVRFLL
jgi:PilZ domain